MEKMINGSSVDENLFTGEKSYGELGCLIGVVDLYGNNIAVIRNKEGQYIYRDAVIDASVQIAKNGPVVYERIFLGKTEKQLDAPLLDSINNSLTKAKNLELFGNGEVNVDLALQQSDNTVFVAEDEFLSYLKMCKNKQPELPLVFAIDAMPYEKTSLKTM